VSRSVLEYLKSSGRGHTRCAGKKSGGVHFDDYFYPYPQSKYDFPGITDEDDDTFNTYPRGFSNTELGRGNWRRDNVNLLIEMVYNGIQTMKPHVSFGVSPIGIWKNNVPHGISGFDAYNLIYCDALAWFDNLTVDYVAPQVYWPFGGSQDYGRLLPWWASETNGRHLYSGNALFRADGWDPSEMPDQIRLNRRTNYVEGSIFFRADNIPANFQGFTDSLKTNLYRYPALSPVMPWKETESPNEPQNVVYEQLAMPTSERLLWNIPTIASDGDTASRYVVYRFEKSEIGPEDIEDAHNIIGITGKRNFSLSIPPEKAGQFYYAVSSLDRNSNESVLSDVVEITRPAAPILTSPANYEQNQPPEIELSWNVVNNAVSYLVQISFDSTFNPPFLQDQFSVADTFKTLMDIEGMATYFWRVKAVNAGGYSNFSEFFSFGTGFPASPMLVSPLDDSLNVPFEPTLIWNTAPGADSYCLQISKNEEFSQTSMILDTCELADTVYAGFTLDPNTYYYWRARGVNSIGNGRWSAIHRFQTREPTNIVGNSVTPTKYALYQCYPNPFNASTNISFYLPRPGRVALKIYDALGSQVAVIADEFLTQGFHKYRFDASEHASGIYFSRLYVDNRVLVSKMLLLK